MVGGQTRHEVVYYRLGVRGWGVSEVRAQEELRILSVRGLMFRVYDL